jgi:solute carrier family 35 protein F1/2
MSGHNADLTLRWIDFVRDFVVVIFFKAGLREERSRHRVKDHFVRAGLSILFFDLTVLKKLNDPNRQSPQSGSRPRSHDLFWRHFTIRPLRDKARSFQSHLFSFAGMVSSTWSQTESYNNPEMENSERKSYSVRGPLCFTSLDTDDDDDASMRERTQTTLEEGVGHVLAHWKIIVLGQILSFLTASTGATQASLHLECNISAPSFSIALTFLVLSLFLIPLYLRRRNNCEKDDATGIEQSRFFGIPLRAPLAVYFLIATMEVQSVYWTYSAFRYTTLTSITLLDSLSLPSAMFLSRFLLKRQYVRVHYLGATVCLAGVVVNMLADYQSDVSLGQGDPYPDKIVGDIYAVSGAIMTGVTHVFLEGLITDFSGPVEYLGVVGLFAFFTASTMSLVLERNEIAQLFSGNGCSAAKGSILLAGSVLTKSLASSGTASFLLVSEAALLNLSLLTTDLWSATFSVLTEGITPPPLFWVALLVIFLGVFLYEMGPGPRISPVVQDEEGDAQQDDAVVLNHIGLL